MVFIKKKEGTNPEYGCKPEERDMNEYIRNGVINLDKPKGPTSHQVTDWVKKIFSLKKAGHGGTLDPAVTGILPILLSNSRKISKLLLYAGKEYVALIHLHGDASEKEVKEAMKAHIGKITQLPPVRSKVKRAKREREIYYIDFLEKDGRDVLFKVGSQHGVYIRRLAEQLGKKIGCGAHLINLRRTKAGGFSEKDNLVTLQDLADAYYFWKEEGNERFLRYCIWPLEHVIKDISKVWVFDTTIGSLCEGAKLAVPGISKLDEEIKKEKLVAVLSLKGELIGIGTSKMTSEQMMKSKKGIAVKMDRTIMKQGIYPKMQKEE